MLPGLRRRDMYYVLRRIEKRERWADRNDNRRSRPDNPRRRRRVASVCGIVALIEEEVDSYLGEYPTGTCVACSYVKSFAVRTSKG